MSFTRQFKFEQDLCEALGFDARMVRRVVIEVEAERYPVITVERWLTDEESDALVKVMRLYDLVERVEIEEAP